MIYIIVFAIFIIIIAMSASIGNVDDNDYPVRKKFVKNNFEKNKSPHKNLKPYVSEEKYYYVRGIWAEKERINTFNSLSFEDLLHLELQPHNAYDKNALAVKTKNGQLIGYIPRNRRKLILTIKSNPTNIAFIHEKATFYSKKRQADIYRLGINVLVGYTIEALEKEIQKFKMNKFFIREKENLKLRLKEINSNYKKLKQSNPELLLNDFLQITSDIIKLNEKLKIFTEEKEIKPPLGKLTVIANYLKKYELTIEVFDKYYSEHFFTNNQYEKIFRRVEQAKMHVTD